MSEGETTPTNSITSWLTSQDGEFTQTFLARSLTAQEHKHALEFGFTCNNVEDETRSALLNIVVACQVYNAGAIILKRTDDDDDDAALTNDDSNDSNMKHPYEYVAIEFLGKMKSKLTDDPLLRVSYANAPTLEQAKLFLRDVDVIQTIECSSHVITEICHKSFSKFVKGSLIEFPSNLHVQEGIMMPIPPSEPLRVNSSHEFENYESDSDEDLTSREFDLCNSDIDEDVNGDPNADACMHMDSGIESYGDMNSDIGFSAACIDDTMHPQLPSPSTPIHPQQRQPSLAYLILAYLLFPAIAIIAIIAAYIVFLTNDPHFHQPFNIQDIARLSANKVIVITGASAGLGKSTAKLLAEAGTAEVVIMGCRDMMKCQKAKNDILKNATGKTKLIPLELDLASISSIQLFAGNLQDILWEYEDSEQERSVPKLDILINNAGIMAVPYQICQETNVELQMHVNHIGHFALTSLLSKNLYNGRVVSVSSLAGALPFLNLDDVNFTQRKWFRTFFGTMQNIVSYGASKRANLLFTHTMNEEFSSMGIEAVAAHPGYSRTSIMHTGWSFAPSWLKEFFASNRIGSMSSDDGALPQIRAALDVENVKANGYVGPLFWTTGRPVVVGSCRRSFHHLPIWGNDIGKRLWMFSEDAVGWNFRNEATNE